MTQVSKIEILFILDPRVTMASLSTSISAGLWAGLCICRSSI